MELEGCCDTKHIMISGERQNGGNCAVMCEAACCSRCAGAASGPPAKGWQAEGKGYGLSCEDVGWGEGGGKVRSRQIKANFRVLRGSSFVVPSLCGLFTSIIDC